MAHGQIGMASQVVVRKGPCHSYVTKIKLCGVHACPTVREILRHNVEPTSPYNAYAVRVGKKEAVVCHVPIMSAK